MGFAIVNDIDENRLEKLLCGDGNLRMDEIYEAGAFDLIQLVAVDEENGDYAGFISCTIPNAAAGNINQSAKADNEQTCQTADSEMIDDEFQENVAIIYAYVAKDFRNCGVFTAMFEAVTKFFYADMHINTSNDLAANSKEPAKKHLNSGKLPIFIVSMDDELFDTLENSSLKPALHSVEYMYTIDSKHFLENTYKYCSSSKNEKCENLDSKEIYNHSGIPENKVISDSTDEDFQKAEYVIEAENISESCVCYSAVDDEDFVIGEAYIDIADNSACLNDMWVEPEYRKQGIATNLVNCALRDFYSSKDNADKSILLHVTGSNTAAITLYEKCGFSMLECVKYYEIRQSALT